MSGDGVTLYLLPGCDINFTGANTDLHLTPPDSGTYQGIAIFMSRDQSHGVGVVNMPLAGGITFAGTYYYPYATLDITASGVNDIARVICYRFSGHGSGTVTVHWLGAEIPAPGPTYLVQ